MGDDGVHVWLVRKVASRWPPRREALRRCRGKAELESAAGRAVDATEQHHAEREALVERAARDGARWGWGEGTPAAAVIAVAGDKRDDITRSERV